MSTDIVGMPLGQKYATVQDLNLKPVAPGPMPEIGFLGNDSKYTEWLVKNAKNIGISMEKTIILTPNVIITFIWYSFPSTKQFDQKIMFDEFVYPLKFKNDRYRDRAIYWSDIVDSTNRTYIRKKVAALALPADKRYSALKSLGRRSSQSVLGAGKEFPHFKVLFTSRVGNTPDDVIFKQEEAAFRADIAAAISKIPTAYNDEMFISYIFKEAYSNFQYFHGFPEIKKLCTVNGKVTLDSIVAARIKIYMYLRSKHAKVIGLGDYSDESVDDRDEVGDEKDDDDDDDDSREDRDDLWEKDEEDDEADDRYEVVEELDYDDEADGSGELWKKDDDDDEAEHLRDRDVDDDSRSCVGCGAVVGAYGEIPWFSVTDPKTKITKDAATAVAEEKEFMANIQKAASTMRLSPKSKIDSDNFVSIMKSAYAGLIHVPAASLKSLFVTTIGKDASTVESIAKFRFQIFKHLQTKHPDTMTHAKSPIVALGEDHDEPAASQDGGISREKVMRGLILTNYIVELLNNPDNVNAVTLANVLMLHFDELISADVEPVAFEREIYHM